MTNPIQIPITCMQDLAQAGQLIAQSQMIKVATPADGFVVAATCHQLGITYLQFQERHHIIKGTVSMRADAMLARFNELGGVHEIAERSADRAAIKLTPDGGDESEFQVTWAEAVNEPFVYDGGQKAQLLELKKPFEQRAVKAKYATPRSRMQMLWARVVSDSVRVVCPEACQGCYTPEEVQDWTEAEEAAKAAPPQAPAPIELDGLRNHFRRQLEGVKYDSAAVAAANQPTETPFENPPDFSICPFAGEHFGKKWDMFPDMHLQPVVANPQGFDGILQGHVEAIKGILASRVPDGTVPNQTGANQ